MVSLRKGHSARLSAYQSAAALGDTCRGSRVERWYKRETKSMGRVYRAVFFLMAITPASAQQLAFIDLVSTPQRVELRYPPAPPAVNESVSGYSGISGMSIGDGSPDIRDPHSLGVYLEGIDLNGINPNLPFEVQFKVLNTGRAAIELPVSADLSDLQPSDSSKEFTYLSLALVVVTPGDRPSIGYVELYGVVDHEGTIRVLEPGEWLRVEAKLSLSPQPRTSDTLLLQPTFWLRRNKYIPHSGGSSRQIDNLYPNQTKTPPVEVRSLGSSVVQPSKQSSIR